MKTTEVIAYVAAAVLAMAGPAYAHEGHDQRVMGVVAAVSEHHIEVKSSDGHAVTAGLDSETRYFKGKELAKREDVTTGSRVVLVIRREGETAVAREVHIGSGDKGRASS